MNTTIKLIDVEMDAGDAGLGMYQIVDPRWSFVVSCDWQCRPHQEQTTTMAVQSSALDEKDAEIGLYQVVDPRWNFTVTCDWQCKPEDEQLLGDEAEQPSSVDIAVSHNLNRYLLYEVLL